MNYIFTKEQFEKLKKRISETEKSLARKIKEKGERALNGTGDSWHSAEFMAAYVEQMEITKRLSELKKLASSAKITEPKEQNEKADIGNKVIIEYENGKKQKFILDGYIIDAPENHCSIYSPLGKAIKDAKKGQTKIVEIQDKKEKIKILEILSSQNKCNDG